MKAHAETAMGAALAAAGYNVTQVRLRQRAHEALAKHHGNVERALRTFEALIEGDDSLFEELLRFYLKSCEYRSDQAPIVTQATGVGSKAADHVRIVTQIHDVGRTPSSAQHKAMATVAKEAARTVLDTHKTSDGRAWGDVGAHELDGMERDGEIARGVKKKLGMLSNSQRFKPIRELISAKTFATVLRETSEGCGG